MEPVQRRMADAMTGVAWRAPEVPLAANASGELQTTAQGVRESLIAQIAAPVRWVDCVGTLRRSGCETFLELGSGRTLSGLIRQIDRGAQAFAADSTAKLARFLEREQA
jgi:[acyl-carrier-protein] S-malonyltransferase